MTTAPKALARAQRPHRRSTPSALSQAEETLALHIRVEKLPEPQRERLKALVQTAFAEGFDAGHSSASDYDWGLAFRPCSKCWERSAAHADLVGNSG